MCEMPHLLAFLEFCHLFAQPFELAPRASSLALLTLALLRVVLDIRSMLDFKYAQFQIQMTDSNSLGLQ